MFNNTNKLELNNGDKLRKIVVSALYSIILTLVLLFVYAIFLAYTDIPENTMSIATIVISGISILIFSIICMLKIKNNGILNGGIIGLIYMIVIYLLSSIVQTGFNLNVYSIIMIIAGVLCGMLGGIIGVNIK